MLSRSARACALALLLACSAESLHAQGRGACVGGGTGHVRVAPRVDAVFVYERCLGGDRIAAITLWRARTLGWEADPDSVAFDQRARLLIVHARDGAHPLTLGRSDSVLVVMLESVDAIAGPIPLMTARLAPAPAAGLVPAASATPVESARVGAAASVIGDRVRALLARDGRVRRFVSG